MYLKWAINSEILNNVICHDPMSSATHSCKPHTSAHLPSFQPNYLCCSWEAADIAWPTYTYICISEPANRNLNTFYSFVSTMKLIPDSNSVLGYILPPKWNNHLFIFPHVIQIPLGDQKLLCLRCNRLNFAWAHTCQLVDLQKFHI